MSVSDTAPVALDGVPIKPIQRPQPKKHAGKVFIVVSTKLCHSNAQRSIYCTAPGPGAIPPPPQSNIDDSSCG